MSCWLSSRPGNAVSNHCVFVAALWSLILTWFAAPERSAAATPETPPRTVIELNRDWRFTKGDFATAMAPGFDDSTWPLVNLPHDWSSDGPFGPEYASGNGYAPGGIGWYRKHFRLDAGDTNRLVAIEFDGIYDYSEVWVNGHLAGGRPYGYSSFECKLTPMVRFGGDNVLAVRVDHSRFADSRWYTGSGIYRKVRLRLTNKLRIAHWGVFVSTPQVSAETASVRVETKIMNAMGRGQSFSLSSTVLSADGTLMGEATTSALVEEGTNAALVQHIAIPHPRLWSPDSPVLYTLTSRVSESGAGVDETTTRFGIRSLRFDPDHGFFLNGAPMKLKGVCLHHEAGCLGAAVPASVWERRLDILKELGVNAVRTSHNPPAPELLDLCDRLGLLVMDEAFDEFTPGKNKWVSGRNNGAPSHFGYAELFKQWSEIDLSDMVRRDRNHPSVILWSIGNEVDYRNDPFSAAVLGRDYRPDHPPAQELITCARPLVRAVKALDTTRPVTAALATLSMSEAVGLPELLDAVGYNYQEERYPADHQQHPRRFIYGSETAGGWPQWLAVRDHEYVGGQFLWTGIDYLGEANRWPNRGSSAGLLDLCGFKKPSAWFRQSLWTDKPMVYLFVSPGQRGSPQRFGGGFGRLAGQESWNWTSNAPVTVRCVTTCPEVVLLLNGRGIATNQISDGVQGVLSWVVPFEPGTLKAVGFGNGRAECQFSLQTAGVGRRIQLLSDTPRLRADGEDICHVEFQIVDAQGVRVPDASAELHFTVEGPATILGIENGDLNSPETGKNGIRSAFHGRGLAILEAGSRAGKVRLTAQAAGLETGSTEIDLGP